MANNLNILQFEIQYLTQHIREEIQAGNTPEQAIELVRLWPLTKKPEFLNKLLPNPQAFEFAANNILQKYNKPRNYRYISPI